MLLCFGLPPAAHENDVVRAILASCLICARLRAAPFHLPSPAVGVALGDHVFCGVIGGRTRREYSIVGDSANIAARLMQRAKVTPGGGVFIEETAATHAHRLSLKLHFRETIGVKGRNQLVSVFTPYVCLFVNPCLPSIIITFDFSRVRNVLLLTVCVCVPFTMHHSKTT